MHHDEFKRIAIEIYGYGWSRQLSSAFGINSRSIREMAKGYRRIPPAVSELLSNLHELHLNKQTIGEQP